MAGAPKPVLGEVDLELNYGDTLVVQGPSGSGKSTLLRALARLDPVRAKRLTLKGQPAESYPAPSWRRRVVLLPAEAGFGEATSVRALLARPFRFQCSARVFEEEAARVRLVRLGLVDLSLEADPRELSTGQRQRLALARALILEPDVLLADEPTSHLDPEAGDLARRELLAFAEQGRGLVWVSHDPALARGPSSRVLDLSPASMRGVDR